MSFLVWTFLNFLAHSVVESRSSTEEEKSLVTKTDNENLPNPNYHINTNVNPWIGLIDMPQVGIRVHIKAHQVFGCVENIADTGMKNNISINDTISNKTLWNELEKVGEHGELKLRKKCNLVGQCTFFLKG